MRKAARRLAREESGFTLTEVLVTMVMMITVMFALYSIFDMSLRVFSFGNDKIEAVENARLGMQRMERELRAAYPYTKLDGDSTNNDLFPSYGSNPSDSITFSNDFDGDRQVDTDTSTEEITYSLSGSELQRNSQPLVDFVVPGSMQFEYFEADGSTPASSESDAEIVRISFTTEVDRGLGGPARQTLTTDVALRNRMQ